MEKLTNQPDLLHGLTQDEIEQLTLKLLRCGPFHDGPTQSAFQSDLPEEICVRVTSGAGSPHDWMGNLLRQQYLRQSWQGYRHLA
jgi:hypothetical protein